MQLMRVGIASHFDGRGIVVGGWKFAFAGRIVFCVFALFGASAEEDVAEDAADEEQERYSDA